MDKIDNNITLYNDQQIARKKLFFDQYYKRFNIDTDNFNEIYDIAVKNTEEIYEERLRNKLSPIVNLITLTKELCEGDDLKQHNKIYQFMDKVKPWISANTAVNDILNIPNS